MQKAKETILIRKTVKQLTDPRDQDGKGLPPIVFFIPAYQRGYRWRKEEVKQLLDDIWDFSYNKPDKKGKKEIYYCLQPLVVKGCDNKNLGDYEVIDGQQRLTTVFIILQAIHHFTIKKWVPADKLAQNPYTPIFSIKYETREHSDEWLPRINDIDFRKENIDYYHIFRAYEQVIEWLTNKNRERVTDPEIKLRGILLDECQFIWYEAGDAVSNNNDAIEIFNRINSGKIELNNAELIKALLLQERNFVEKDADDRPRMDVTRQSQIALEWDEMERFMQKEDFWCFIYKSDNPLKYSTRIEYIFDLMTHKTQEHSYRYTFDKFYAEYQQMRETPRKFVEDKWHEIQQYMFTLQQWYDDRTLYHYIGYLVEYTAPEENLIQTLKNLEQEEQEETGKDGEIIKRYRLSKLQFMDKILNMIRDVLRIKRGDKMFDVTPQQLRYNSSSGIVRKILLLYNMQTLLNNKDSEARFPLDLYKNGKWDVEHIASQTDFQLTEANCKEWVFDIVRYMTGEMAPKEEEQNKYIEKIKNYKGLNKADMQLVLSILTLLEKDKNTEENRQNCLALVNDHFNANKGMDDIQKNYIWNLALLNSSINRSYKNAIFPIKRMYIIDNESRGVFVPICTKNAFQKVYGRKLNQLMSWSIADGTTYWENICKVLGEKKFLSSTVLNHKPSKEKFI